MDAREATQAVPGCGDHGHSTSTTAGYVLILCGVAAVCVEAVGLHHGAHPLGAGVWAGVVAGVSGAWSLYTREGRAAKVLAVLNTITAISLVFSSSFILVHSGHQFEGVWFGVVARHLILCCYSVLLVLGLVILGAAVEQVKEMRGRGEKNIGQQQGWQYANLGVAPKVI